MPIADYTTASVDWMRHGACVPAEARKLPWVKDSTETSSTQKAQLAAICRTCPVFAACARYVVEESITGGFWAGRHRERHQNNQQNDGRDSGSTGRVA